MNDILLKFAEIVDKAGSLLNLNSTSGSIAIGVGMVIVIVILISAIWKEKTVSVPPVTMPGTVPCSLP